MPEALTAAIAEIANSHGSDCRLDGGSPSAAVAAWRIESHTVEYLVLCDSSLVLAFRDGVVTEVTDDRITKAAGPLIEEQLQGIRNQQGSVTGVDVRRARRAAVERTRNRVGGFWCCHTDPKAASAALHGRVQRDRLRAIAAASDGATRGYQLLGIQPPRDLVATADADEVAAVIAAIRNAERGDRTLAAQGRKQHDDATIVAATFHPQRGPH